MPLIPSHPSNGLRESQDSIEPTPRPEPTAMSNNQTPSLAELAIGAKTKVQAYRFDTLTRTMKEI